MGPVKCFCFDAPAIYVNNNKSCQNANSEFGEFPFKTAIKINWIMLCRTH